ncbi:MAG: glutamine--fructose-6-phosphate transaminase (isomerizing) [Candidatus Gottesmanbacteria bacterium]
MCGIFGLTNDKNSEAAQTILDGLKKLEYRGYDSWGIAIIPKGSSTIQVEKHIGKIGEAKTNLPSGLIGIGHTRWATHGGVTDLNAHPHLDCTKKIAVIHNGIIENYDVIKKRLIKLGHKFISETDTEVAAHSIEEYYQRMSFTEAVRKAFNEFTGLSAIIVLNSETSEFIAIKTGSPLVVGFGPKENLIASDAVALLNHTRRVHFLEDKEMVRVTKDKVELFDCLSGQPKKPKIQTLDWQIQEVNLGKYPYYMIKEINEQPKVLRGISEGLIEEISNIAQIIKKSYGTYMVGCGTAFYAALSGTYLFSRICHRHVNAAPGSEFGYLVDFLKPKSLVIAFSQSGETIDIIESVGRAKEKGSKILAIVNNLGSTLYRMSDYKILLGAGPEKCVLATKSFTAKIAILLLLAHALNSGLAKGKILLDKTIKEVEILLKPKSLEKIKKLANIIVNKENIYVIGRGQSYPVALEAALKIKEISYIHAEGFAAGELKHGVIALIEKGTPCIIFAPNDETYGAVISGAMEMKARGGYIIGVSFKNNEIFDYYIPVDDCGDATIIPNVVVAQLLGYYLALKKGNDPDKPRNLAKSVTVK